MIEAMLFVLLYLLISMKIDFQNRVFLLLGSYSLEIYLIHELFIIVFRSSIIYIENNILYFGTVAVASILTAVFWKELKLRKEGKKNA